jgi:hypothetical protein
MFARVMYAVLDMRARPAHRKSCVPPNQLLAYSPIGLLAYWPIGLLACFPTGFDSR